MTNRKAFKLLGLTLLLLMLVSTTTVASPLNGAGPSEIQLTEHDNGRSIDLKGEVLVLNLESNPSTGYSWQVQGMNQGILRQLDATEWLSSAPDKLGAPGIQVLRFAAVGKGRTNLELVYARSWETAASAKTFSLEVRVTKPSGNVNYPQPAAQEALAEPAAVDSIDALPSSYNWCDLGDCTPVRDQGACGSCWAFGTVGPLEQAILIQDSESRDLSEQYLVSCNTDGWGCDGGWWAHDYHEWKIPPSETDFGAVYEGDFEYTATDGSCEGPYTHHETIDGWAFIGTENSVPSTDAIKQAIVDHGPVAAAVCVNSEFQSYDSGLFNPRRPCNSINHAIVLTGWDDAMGAWRLRNSWGPNWGEDGYMWIAYGKSYVGYSANYVVYGGGGEPTPTPEPTVGPTPTPTPEPTATPEPGETMHVSDISMWYDPVNRNKGNVVTQVTIVDDAGEPVSDALVYLRMDLPGGGIASGSGGTGADGTVTFSLSIKVTATGTYISEVTGVTHASLSYDPGANVETSETFPYN
jgi:inhibitor of cysteine peptidase